MIQLGRSVEGLSTETATSQSPTLETEISARTTARNAAESSILTPRQLKMVVQDLPTVWPLLHGHGCRARRIWIGPINSVSALSNCHGTDRARDGMLHAFGNRRQSKMLFPLQTLA